MGELPKRVLIVEDDFLLSAAYQKYIYSLGHQVIGTANTGLKSIEKTWKYSPDLIIMNIKLRGEMDGIEATEVIRTFSDAPVIYLTGLSDQAEKRRAEFTGFIEYIVKPITEADLAGPLKKAFPASVGQKHSSHQAKRVQPKKVSDRIAATIPK